jgi:catechol 2,3-dioxygenase-like lactoylglutathione lyase family enzyme
VSHVSTSADFYRVVLAPLGIEQTWRDPPEFGALSFVQRPTPDPLHIAFIAASQAAVRAFHRAGVEAGYRSHGAPGLRPYAADYYAAYLLDPDGHNVEAVHRSPETRAKWKWLASGLG